MAPFYAYLKPVDQPEVFYLMVFASRAVADEWWRAISTSPSLDSTAIRRIGPQFFAHNPRRIAKISQTIAEGAFTRGFSDKIFFIFFSPDTAHTSSPLHGNITLRNITDHISGDWFYIRSKGSDPVYWYCGSESVDANGRELVIASKTRNTRFRITADKNDTPIGTVMIGRDSVKLSFRDREIQAEGNRTLCSATSGESWKFSKFTNGFRLNGQGKAYNSDLPYEAIIKTDDGDEFSDGQEWELCSEGLLGEGEGRSLANLRSQSHDH